MLRPQRSVFTAVLYKSWRANQDRDRYFEKVQVILEKREQKIRKVPERTNFIRLAHTQW